MSAPIQPVTLSLAELTAIKTALTEKAHALRAHAASRRGAAIAPMQATERARADKYDDLAARLSFARAGEPIQVVDQC